MQRHMSAACQQWCRWEQEPFQQLAYQLARHGLAAARLYQEIENFAFVVDRPPKPESPPPDYDHHLIEMPVVARIRAAAAKVTSDERAELQAPAPHGFMSHIKSALGQQILDIAVAQGEPSVEPYSVADNFWRRPMAIKFDKLNRQNLP